MGRAPTALGLLACLALIGAGCGGDGDSGSTTSPASVATVQEQSETTGGATKAGGDGKAGGDSSPEKGRGGASTAREAKEARKFVPKQHNDSGGGSKRFIRKSGDNSIQEFGKEAGGPAFGAASAALHNFLDARAAPNWAAACSYMSESLVKSFDELAAQSKELRGAGCAKLLETMTNPAGLPELRREARRADVVSLRVEGKRAFVIYRGLEGGIMAISMANEGGSWKVSSLAGLRLPIN